MGQDDLDEKTMSLIAWILDLLSHTHCMVMAKTHDKMRSIGQRIAADPTLSEDNKQTLRLIFKARWEEIDREGQE